MENRSKYNNKSRCCYDQDAVVLFRLSNLGAFVFEFTLDGYLGPDFFHLREFPFPRVSQGN